MKHFFLPLALLAAAPAFADPAPKGQDVTITIGGVEGARGGHVLVSLQTESQFLKAGGVAGQKVTARQGEMTFVFHNVAPGSYAFTVLHDQDDDGQMKMGADGMPAEGWAMHNGTLLLAAPTFEAVEFDVGDQPVALMEPMTYFTQ